MSRVVHILIPIDMETNSQPLLEGAEECPPVALPEGAEKMSSSSEGAEECPPAALPEGAEECPPAALKESA